MKHMRTLATLVALAISSFALAGAWGVGSFENDSALDWVYSLESSTTNDVIANALAAASRKGYLEADACSEALAAVEIVGSVNVGSAKHLPAEVQSWIARVSFSPKDQVLSKANMALEACVNGHESELAQLWEESAPKEWESYISELRNKLK